MGRSDLPTSKQSKEHKLLRPMQARRSRNRGLISPGRRAPNIHNHTHTIWLCRLGLSGRRMDDQGFLLVLHNRRHDPRTPTAKGLCEVVLPRGGSAASGQCPRRKCDKACLWLDARAYSVFQATCAEEENTIVCKPGALVWGNQANNMPMHTLGDAGGGAACHGGAVSEARPAKGRTTLGYCGSMGHGTNKVHTELGRPPS